MATEYKAADFLLSWILRGVSVPAAESLGTLPIRAVSHIS